MSFLIKATCFTIVAFLITALVVIGVIYYTAPPELPLYVVDAVKRKDLPIKICVNTNEHSKSLEHHIKKQLLNVVNEYNSKLECEFLQFETSSQNTLNRIVVSVEPAKHGCMSTFDGKFGILAHATLAGVRICLDESEDWHDETLLYKTLLHEVGHAVGLRHVSGETSIMVKNYSDVPMHLTEFDVNLIKTMLDRKDVSDTFRIQYKMT